MVYVGEGGGGRGEEGRYVTVSSNEQNHITYLPDSIFDDSEVATVFGAQAEYFFTPPALNKEIRVIVNVSVA